MDKNEDIHKMRTDAVAHKQRPPAIKDTNSCVPYSSAAENFTNK